MYSDITGYAWKDVLLDVVSVIGVVAIVVGIAAIAVGYALSVGGEYLIQWILGE